jgi:hypothetical protein
MSLERAILSGGFGCEFTALFNTSAAFDPAAFAIPESRDLGKGKQGCGTA